MRKIINSAFVSLDGVTEDPSSWATFDLTQETKPLRRSRPSTAC
jgi:hypothetical protein